MIQRKITPEIISALKDTPVVLIHGARQTGKSTLVKYLIQNYHKAEYITFDDTLMLSAALSDPIGFLSGFNGNVVLDEVQKAPELFSSIKLLVDKNRKPGKFILTGSANIYLIPRLSESLAGRMQILTLYPFSSDEISGKKDSFIDSLFSNAPVKHLSFAANKKDALKKIITGGYPEVIKKKNIERRKEWFQSYINSILQRDIKDVSNIEGFSELPRLLSLLAARSGTLFNIAEISRSISIPQTTLKRHITYINAVYLIKFIPAYSSNLGKRLMKSPKIIFVDTGLASYLTSLNELNSLKDSEMKGRLFENFVIMELTKQGAWSKSKPQLYHYRTLSNIETDIILESKNKIVGIEVKSGSTVNSKDFSGLKYLSNEFSKKFHRGIIFYNGHEIVPFGKNMYAIPVECLWNSVKEINN